MKPTPWKPIGLKAEIDGREAHYAVRTLYRDGGVFTAWTVQHAWLDSRGVVLKIMGEQ